MDHIARRSPAPTKASHWDGEYDVVIAGSGAAGLASALFLAWEGNKVLVLEKANELGGTTRKAAFWYWVPNNKAMQALDIRDEKADCIQYMARLSQPQSYDADSPHFGLTDWEYDTCEAIYDYTSTATELLAEKGALEYRHCESVPDYWAELPENKAPTGRVLVPKGAGESMSDGGEVAVRTMSETAREAGVDIRTGHRVQCTVVNHKGTVIGVEADTGGGETLRFKARKGVIFATGGFIHDVEMRKNFLSAPIFGSCAVVSNEGDFVNIGSALGAPLRNMTHAWMCPVVLDKALAKDPELIGTFSPSGDSMIYVDREGRRVTNEKLAYNESAQAFFKWSPTQSTYPNLVLMAVWDRRSQEHSASEEYGRFIVPEGKDDAHVIKGETLEEIATGISARLKKYGRSIGNVMLVDNFATNLKATIARFNDFARNGEDLDFHRGDRQVERLFNGPAAADPVGPNPTMYPISDTGPYYAALLAGGSHDTKGGPQTNRHGQVLDAMGKAIPGLYGVGNCVASVSGRAYWAGGATLGPILAFAYLAAKSLNEQPARD